MRSSDVVMPKRALCVLLLALLAPVGGPSPHGLAGAARSASVNPGCRGEDGLASFRAADRLVLTYLYYWYDSLSLDHPSLALRPPSDGPFDWADPAWHQRQLVDMADVGVDVALAVYWGDRPAWSLQGLDALVAARESLLASGLRPPAIAPFFDSNLYATLLAETPALADLRSEDGMDVFAGQIARFFERVPACHWARIDGRPLVFLWRPDTEDGGVLRFEQRTIDALYRRLRKRLGVRPYIVRERTWDGYARADGMSLRTDDVFAWGAALSGPLFVGRTAAVGPGYDDRLIPERPGYVRDRDGGTPYARDLRTAVLSGAPWLLLETWNELWEATAIGETAQYGRDYLELTKQYVRVFHQLGDQRVRDGWVDLGHRESDYLALLAEAPEERGTPVFLRDRVGARPHVEPTDGAGYFHFALPPRLRPASYDSIAVRVEYFDQGRGGFALEYDGEDRALGDGIYTSTTPVIFEDTGRWRWHTFTLPRARFQRRQYGGSGDFRIRDQPADGEPSHVFGRVVVSTESGARPVLLGPESLSLLRETPGHFFELRWHGVEGAAGYAVQLEPLDSPEATVHGYSQEDRRRCEGGAAWSERGPLRAVAVEERCLLQHVPSAGPGLYRWRVRALDALGEPLGDPSDWGLLLAGG